MRRSKYPPDRSMRGERLNSTVSKGEPKHGHNYVWSVIPKRNGGVQYGLAYSVALWWKHSVFTLTKMDWWKI